MLLCTIIIDFDKKVNEGLRKSRCFLQEKHLLLPIYVSEFRGDGKSLQKRRNLGIMVERDRGGIGYEKGLVEERVV
jgi:hypothetical protein